MMHHHHIPDGSVVLHYHPMSDDHDLDHLEPQNFEGFPSLLARFDELEPCRTRTCSLRKHDDQ